MMKFEKLVAIIAILNTTYAFAKAAPSGSPESSPSKTTAAPAAAEIEATETPKAWSAVVSAEHYLGFRPDVWDYTQFYADFTYKLGAKGADRLRVLQGVQKHYDVAVTEKEVRLDDTALFWYHDFAAQILLFKTTLRLSATLPVSTVSKVNGNITRAGAQMQFKRAFFNGGFTVHYWPSFTYYFNRFTTTVSGTPLTHSALTNRVIVEVPIISRLSFNLDLGYTFASTHKSPFASETPPIKGKYAFGAELGYEVSDHLNARLGVSQADSFTKEGRYEILAFDPYMSQAYLALDVSF